VSDRPAASDCVSRPAATRLPPGRSYTRPVSALATRLLVLGVVRIFEPANAYQLRRELLSWEVDRWANINPGSVYGMLASLEKAGLVSRHELVGVNGRPVGVYTTTERGSAEFPALVERALRTVEDWVDVADLRAALSMVPFVPRGPVVDAVGERILALSGIVERMTGLRAGESGARAVPPHVLEGFDLERSLATVQLEWLRRYRDLVAGGAFRFAGETGWDWMPAEDDPGWAMVRDRQLYLPQLPAEG
jgi:DNA-binding PadR family transcriptional regulator